MLRRSPAAASRHTWWPRRLRRATGRLVVGSVEFCRSRVSPGHVLKQTLLSLSCVVLAGGLVGGGLYSYAIVRAEYRIRVGRRPEPIGRSVGAGTEFPRLIHQLWRTDSVPESYREAVASCRRLNPGWSYRLWTDESMAGFIADNYPLFYGRFVSYEHAIQRVDFARYFILLHYGGATIDVDLACRVPLDDVLRDKRAYDFVAPGTTPGGVTVEFMAAKRGARFVRHLAYGLAPPPADYLLPYVTVVFSTGPMYLTNKLADYRRPEEVFVIPRHLYRDKYFRNLHAGSWHGWDYVIIRLLELLVRRSTLVVLSIVFTLAFVYRRRSVSAIIQTSLFKRA